MSFGNLYKIPFTATLTRFWERFRPRSRWDAANTRIASFSEQLYLAQIQVRRAIAFTTAAPKK